MSIWEQAQSYPPMPPVEEVIPKSEPPDDLPHLDVVTLMCGRFYSTHHTINTLQNMRYPRNKLHLIWYSNSDKPAFHSSMMYEADKLVKEGFDVRVVVDQKHRPSRNAFRELKFGDSFPGDHCDVIAEIYCRATDMTQHDIMFLEDDISAPAHTFKRFVEVSRETGAGYVVGQTFDRHTFTSPEGKHGLFIWELIDNPHNDPRNRRIAASTEFEEWRRKGVQKIGLGPLSCAYVPRWAWDKISPPKMKARPPLEFRTDNLPGCDMVLCTEMERLGIMRVCDFSTKLGHWDSKGVCY